MHKSVRTLVAAVFVICGTLAYPGCTPERPPLPSATSADAGNYSFVRQAVPVLLGRKSKGHTEVRLLADLIAATDRGTVARALMDQPEFVDHWAEHFVDRLRVHRETRKRHDLCYGDPMRTTSDSGSTARIILNRPASSGAIVGAPSFNMTDLIRSSLEADNLSVMYRAHLFALLDKPATGNEITEQNVRDDFGATFGNMYVNRQIGCLRCHNSELSLTGETSGWDRSHPIPGKFEKSLFGSRNGRDV